MRLTLNDKKSIVKAEAALYQRATKKGKKAILDSFVERTGLNRSYASVILSKYGKTVSLGGGLRIVGDLPRKQSRRRERYYDGKVLSVLRKVWAIMDWICGKRLAAALPEVLPILVKAGEITMDRQTEQKVLKISAATIDRLLAPERKKIEIRGRSHTKPGSFLKSQIPIRTSDQWDDKKPGFVEADLVGHDGGNAKGDFCYTLNLTDICTGWTETRAVKNKAQIWVFKALLYICKLLPFPLLGLDSDNGSEFINAHLFAYCKENGIDFTRSRPNRKNDNCFIEERNNSIVRRAVGYARYDSEEQLKTLNELYSLVRLYTNYFQPIMKLVKKERVGSRVRKVYDKPTTPYQRVLASPDVSEIEKRKIRKVYNTLNPAQLKRDISMLQNKLANSSRQRIRKRA
jgi:hypothetical protein